MVALRKPMTVAMSKPTQPANAPTMSKPRLDLARLSDLCATVSTDPWAGATQKKRDIARARLNLIGVGVQYVSEGASVNSVAQMLADKLSLGHISSAQQLALSALGKAPSLPTIKRWLADYKAHGLVGLLPAHTGRVRVDYGWEARAVELYNLPSNPDAGGVAMALQREGYEHVTHERVKTYLDSLSALYTSNSPQRMGEHLHRLTAQAYQPRNKESFQVGEVWAGDGHTIDVYLAHHKTGKPTRYELTLFIDVGSLYVAGWNLSKTESALNTMIALSKGMTENNHIPRHIYIDRGSGWKAKMLNNEMTGWYQSLGISVIAALPRNPHGKSWVERFFRELRDKHDKFFAGGMVYCGDDMAADVITKVHNEAMSGKRVLPSMYDYAHSLNQFIDQHHQTPKDVLDGRTPAQAWATFERFGLERLGVNAASVITRPAELKKVRRNMIFLHGRMYFHLDLAHYQDKKTELIVEYDIHDDRCVWVHDPQKRLICVAEMVRRADGLSESRILDAENKRAANAEKRIENKLREVKAQNAPMVDMDALADRLELPAPSADQLLNPLPHRPEPVKTKQTQQRVIDIDIY